MDRSVERPPAIEEVLHTDKVLIREHALASMLLQYVRHATLRKAASATSGNRCSTKLVHLD